MKIQKFTACLIVSAIAFSFAACSKKEVRAVSFIVDASANNISSESPVITEEIPVLTEEPVVVEILADAKPDPEITKYNQILEKMTAQFKADFNKDGISISEFISDLKDVLKEDDEISSGDISLLYLIDKTHKIGKNYEPKGLVKLVKNNDYIINKNNLSLRPVAADALRVMAQAAKKDGVTLDVSSTYRSYQYQNDLFNYWVSVDGLEEAERESARPGTSQHQLGVAIDFGSISDAYDKTDSGQWMYKHASEYGWSLSFPKGYEKVTGFKWECWHFRYIGKKAAAFQKKYFNNVQQFMIEFVDAWKNAE